MLARAGLVLVQAMPAFFSKGDEDQGYREVPSEKITTLFFNPQV
jgi:hypothetical protein